MNKRERYVTAEEMNEILSTIEQFTNICYGEWREYEDKSLATHSFIEDGLTTFKVTTKWYLRGNRLSPCTYILKKDGMVKTIIKGSDAYATLQKYYKCPDYRTINDPDIDIPINERGSFAYSAKPILGYNPKYNGKEIYLYEYDLNSAYPDQMLKEIPDTSKYHLFDIVKEGQVGFMFDYQLTLVDRPGLYADIIFDLMDSPFKRFVNVWYNKKKYAKNKEEKENAKQHLNFSIGYTQRTNPFIRGYIIHKCNQRIASLIDENTALWNTDAIYSTVPRPELELGNEIGQWKLDEGLFRLKKLEYQKVGEIPHYRGIPQKWFSIDFNLIEDDLPTHGNIYKFNKDLFRIEEIEYAIH